MRPRSGGEEVVIQREVAATPEEVFRYFADREKWLFWQGTDAEIELHEGGVFRVNVIGDGYASGRFLEVVPAERVVFTWGWERPELGVPPGSSVVRIDLVPSDGGTIIRLSHSGLPSEALDSHRGGWANYVARLGLVAQGRDPGPDPLRTLDRDR